MMPKLSNYVDNDKWKIDTHVWKDHLYLDGIFRDTGKGQFKLVDSARFVRAIHSIESNTLNAVLEKLTEKVLSSEIIKEWLTDYTPRLEFYLKNSVNSLHFRSVGVLLLFRNFLTLLSDPVFGIWWINKKHTEPLIDRLNIDIVKLSQGRLKHHYPVDLEEHIKILNDLSIVCQHCLSLVLFFDSFIFLSLYPESFFKLSPKYQEYLRNFFPYLFEELKWEIKLSKSLNVLYELNICKVRPVIPQCSYIYLETSVLEDRYQLSKYLDSESKSWKSKMNLKLNLDQQKTLIDLDIKFSKKIEAMLKRKILVDNLMKIFELKQREEFISKHSKKDCIVIDNNLSLLSKQMVKELFSLSNCGAFIFCLPKDKVSKISEYSKIHIIFDSEHLVYDNLEFFSSDELWHRLALLGKTIGVFNGEYLSGERDFFQDTVFSSGNFGDNWQFFFEYSPNNHINQSFEISQTIPKEGFGIFSKSLEKLEETIAQECSNDENAQKELGQMRDNTFVKTSFKLFKLTMVGERYDRPFSIIFRNFGSAVISNEFYPEYKKYSTQGHTQFEYILIEWWSWLTYAMVILELKKNKYERDWGPLTQGGIAMKFLLKYEFLLKLCRTLMIKDLYKIGRNTIREGVIYAQSTGGKIVEAYGYDFNSFYPSQMRDLLVWFNFMVIPADLLQGEEIYTFSTKEECISHTLRILKSLGLSTHGGDIVPGNQRPIWYAVISYKALKTDRNEFLFKSSLEHFHGWLSANEIHILLEEGWTISVQYMIIGTTYTNKKIFQEPIECLLNLRKINNKFFKNLSKLIVNSTWGVLTKNKELDYDGELIKSFSPTMMGNLIIRVREKMLRYALNLLDKGYIIYLINADSIYVNKPLESCSEGYYNIDKVDEPGYLKNVVGKAVNSNSPDKCKLNLVVHRYNEFTYSYKNFKGKTIVCKETQDYVEIPGSPFLSQDYIKGSYYHPRYDPGYSVTSFDFKSKNSGMIKKNDQDLEYL